MNSNWGIWISEVLTAVAHLFFLWCFFIKRRPRLLATNTVGNVVMIAGLSLISAWAGLVTLAIGIGRDSTNFLIDKYKWHRLHYASLIVWLCTFIVASVFLWQSLGSVLILAAGVLFTVAIWQKSIPLFRLIAIIVNALWVFYLFYVGNVSGSYMRMALLGFSVVGLVSYFAMRPWARNR